MAVMLIFLDFGGVLHHKDAAGREIKLRDMTSLSSLAESDRSFIDNKVHLITGKNLFSLNHDE